MTAVFAIEIARRLICEQDWRTYHERAGKGNPLLLASRELNRVMIDAVGQTYLPKKVSRPETSTAPIPSDKFIRKKNIFFRRECRYELIGLENKADLSTAYER
jgi:hypothetical protein